MRARTLWIALLVGLASGCDSEGAPPDAAEDDRDQDVDDDDASLDRDVVESIPEGDAVGDGFSGSYATLATAVSCVGECGPIETNGVSSVVCSPYAESMEWITAYQDGGSLRVDLDDDGHIGINLDGYVPVRLLGGIDADGSWDIGGYGTKFGGTLESTARVRGTWREGEPLEATIELHIFGVVGETQTDCYMTQQLVSLDSGE